MPPPSLSLDQEYENLTFDGADNNDDYENISIGFAGTGVSGENPSGPLPPLPLQRQPIAPQSAAGRQSYENVELKKSPVRIRQQERGRDKDEVMVVEDDDETLFGKEGPPGMQENIYENFGPDRGNRVMCVEELLGHVEKLGKKGLSTEYYRIRNEPIKGSHKVCR